MGWPFVSWAFCLVIFFFFWVFLCKKYFLKVKLAWKTDLQFSLPSRLSLGPYGCGKWEYCCPSRSPLKTSVLLPPPTLHHLNVEVMENWKFNSSYYLSINTRNWNVPLKCVLKELRCYDVGTAFIKLFFSPVFWELLY